MTCAAKNVQIAGVAAYAVPVLSAVVVPAEGEGPIHDVRTSVAYLDALEAKRAAAGAVTEAAKPAEPVAPTKPSNAPAPVTRPSVAPPTN